MRNRTQRPFVIKRGHSGLTEIHSTRLSERHLSAWDRDRQLGRTTHPERPLDAVDDGIRIWHFRDAAHAPLPADELRFAAGRLLEHPACLGPPRAEYCRSWITDPDAKARSRAAQRA